MKETGTPTKQPRNGRGAGRENLLGKILRRMQGTRKTPSNDISRFPPLKLPKGWCFVSDSNEQAKNHKGYDMRPEGGGDFLTQNLWVGDYSLQDPDGVLHDRSVAVERKSLENVISDAAHDRERFERCLEKMAKLVSPAIVIEADWTRIGSSYAGMTKGRWRGPKMSPNAVQGSIISWAQRHRVPTYFAANRYEGERVTRWILCRYAIDVKKGLVIPSLDGELSG